MSQWNQLDMDAKVTAILDVRSHNLSHHFGRPFLTPYQIAIEFADQFPGETEAIGKPVGGKGTGQQDSLAQYIALELSKGIRDGTIANIEGRFLHRAHLQMLRYRHGTRFVESSSMQAYDLSIYRLKDA